MDVVLAGPGVGGVAIAVGSGQHPLAAGPAGVPSACRMWRVTTHPFHCSGRLNSSWSTPSAFCAPRCSRWGWARNSVPPKSRAVMLICMVKTPFIWFCVCIWPDCSAERQWAEVHTFLLRIWRVRHFAKRPFSERNDPLIFA